MPALPGELDAGAWSHERLAFRTQRRHHVEVILPEPMKRVVIIVILLSLATARAAISFGPAGTGTITFATWPGTNEWATRSIVGSAGLYFFGENHFFSTE
jgi:hypothetical protein